MPSDNDDNEMVYCTNKRVRSASQNVSEYATSVWDPHYTPDTKKLEQVQRRAARFVCNNYSPISSVTQMLSGPGWQQLKDRPKHIRLALFYEIVHHLIAAPHEDIIRKTDSRKDPPTITNIELLDSIRTHINVPLSTDYIGMESPASGYSTFGYY